jgi:hypothetical protein
MATADQLPGELDLSCVQGDDLNIQLSVDENLSGYTFIASIHELHGTTATVTTALTTGSALSTLQVSFPASVTSALAVTGKDGAHNWKAVYTDPAGLVRTWVKGAFTVLTKI